MPFVIGRGFAEVQILKKSETSPISGTIWIILMTYCKDIDIDKI